MENPLTNAINKERAEVHLGDTAATPTTTAPFNLSKIGVALVPFTPVDFATDPMLAWGRLIAYGSLSYLMWGKSKAISYAALAATGVSLATSLSAKAMAK